MAKKQGTGFSSGLPGGSPEVCLAWLSFSSVVSSRAVTPIKIPGSTPGTSLVVRTWSGASIKSFLDFAYSFRVRSLQADCNRLPDHLCRLAPHVAIWQLGLHPFSSSRPLPSPMLKYDGDNGVRILGDFMDLMCLGRNPWDSVRSLFQGLDRQRGHYRNIKVN